MADNFITSMLGEGGKISHKRVISVLFSLVGIFIAAYTIIKYKEYTLDMYHSTLIFIAVMSGVATVAQIVSLVKGSPEPSKTDDNSKQDAK